jgi:DNA-directed RNA polymerase subunit RPC12/RpoP
MFDRIQPAPYVRMECHVCGAHTLVVPRNPREQRAIMAGRTYVQCAVCGREANHHELAGHALSQAA